MDTKMELLVNLLDCGSLDIDKLAEIIDTCEEFNEDALYNAVENLKAQQIKISCNELMFELLSDLEFNLIDKIKDELNIELNEDDFELFINFLDTHITYTGENEQVNNWIENNCELVEF